MWALDNDTPFEAQRTWVRDVDGAEVLLIAVKATFTVAADGSTSLAKEQEKVCRAPIYAGDPGRSSLLCDSDLAFLKPTTDVLLRGRAHAPDGRAVPHVDVTMKLAGMTKVARVIGDRRWKMRGWDLAPTEPEPFLSLPLDYEHAYGGIDRGPCDPAKHAWEPRNPVGVGFAVESEHLLDQPLPNVENPRELITSWKQRPCPIGFGPIARSWSPRIELAGTFDDEWESERRPLWPSNFDVRFHQAAPLDQQTVRYLSGGESVELINLTPHGRLCFRLPQVALGFVTKFTGGLRSHEARLQTVLIDAERSRFTMVWSSALACHSDVYKLQWTRVFEKRRIGRPAKSSPLLPTSG